MAAEKKFLDKVGILTQQDMVTEDIQIPEWGDAWVRVRTLSASERDHFEAGSRVGVGKKAKFNQEHFRARLCLLCLIDEEGNRLFDEGDTFPLGAKSAAAIDRIFTVAQRLNKFTDEDVDELTKNSQPDQSEDSVTG